MTEQLQNDIAYCIDELNLSNELIGNVLRSCEELGNISAEYLMEEFVFQGGDSAKYDDIEYLNIAEFNAMYWVYLQWKLNNNSSKILMIY